MSSRPPEKGSDEGAPKAKEWPELIVSGCADQTISKIVKGTYRVSTMNHSKPVYKKYEKAKGLDVLVYFWDDRDGLELCGWWFGPAVGGDQVWAFHPSRTSTTPPANEWNIPNDGPIDPTFTITPRAKGSGSSASAEKKSEDLGGDDDVRKQLESMKKERDEFAARMEEIQKRAEERRRREEELKRRMEGFEDPDKRSAKRPRAEDEEQRRDGAMATARAEEERRRLEREAQKKKEEDRRLADEEARQRREEERRRVDEEAQRRREERLRKEEEDARRRAERRKQEEVEERKRRELEQAKRKEEEDRRRKEEAKRQEERQRKLNEEAKRRKEEIAVLGMFDAMARMSAATPQDFDGLRLMLERSLETLLPHTGKQKSILRTEAERVLKRTEHYVKTAEEQQRRWEEWCDLREQVPTLLSS